MREIPNGEIQDNAPEQNWETLKNRITDTVLPTPPGAYDVFIPEYLTDVNIPSDADLKLREGKVWAGTNPKVTEENLRELGVKRND